MQTAVDALLNEANGSTETSKIVAVCAEVAAKHYESNATGSSNFNVVYETFEMWNKKG